MYEISMTLSTAKLKRCKHAIIGPVKDKAYPIINVLQKQSIYKR